MRVGYLLALLPIFLGKPLQRPDPPVLQRADTDRLSIVLLDIGEPELGADFRWEAEHTGRLLLALDANLASLPGVVPRIGPAPRPPSLKDLPASMTATWVGALRTSGTASAWTVSLSVCPEDDACFYLEDTGTSDDAERLASTLATNVASFLQRSPQAWDTEPPSRDDYASLIAGRAAASFYGLTPALEAEAIGIARRDPIVRAVLIDPLMARSQWLLGRHWLNHNNPAAAARSFARAGSIAVAPQDRAVALAADGKWQTALTAWSQTLAEPRFAIAAAAVAVHLQDDASTDAWLELVPAGTTDDPELLRLLADRAGDGVSEEVLIRWAEAAPADPVPVRRHVHWLARYRDYATARERVTELAERGGSDAAGLALALDAELGLDTPSVPETLATTVDVRMIQARAAARRGDWVLAGALVDAVLATEPFCPEALALQVDFLVASGRREAAAEVLATLRSADPAWGRRDLPWR